jgi:hypothetical protein
MWRKINFKSELDIIKIIIKSLNVHMMTGGLLILTSVITRDPVWSYVAISAYANAIYNQVRDPKKIDKLVAEYVTKNNK